jgi:predicted permease
LLSRRIAVTAMTVLLTLTLTMVASAVGVVRASVWATLPFDSPDRLVRLWHSGPGGTDVAAVGASEQAFQRWKSGLEGVSSVEAFLLFARDAIIRAGDRLSTVRKASVTEGFFRTLGVAPMIGQEWSCDPSEVIVSHQFWRSRLTSEPSLHEILLIAEGGYRLRVSGVMPPEFTFPFDADLWECWKPRESARRSSIRLGVLGRLRKGISLHQADAEVRTSVQSWSGPGRSSGAVSLTDTLQAGAMLPVSTGLTAVLVVGSMSLLTVVVIQIAQLFRRRPEIAVRRALGASNATFARQFSRESIRMCGMAALLSIAFAYWIAHTLILRLPSALRVNDATGTLLTVVVTTMVGAAICSAALTTLSTVAARSVGTIWPSGFGNRTTSYPGTAGAAFVLTIIAMSFALIALTTVLSRAIQESLASIEGIDPAGVVIVEVRLPTLKSGETVIHFPAPRFSRTAKAIVERAKQIPGVDHAGAIGGASFMAPVRPGIRVKRVSHAPFSSVTPTERWPEVEEADGLVAVRRISPGVLDSLSIEVIAGRGFADTDDLNPVLLDDWSIARGPGVALLNETAASMLGAGTALLGAHVAVESDLVPARRIVGIVRDIRLTTVDSRSRVPVVYIPFAQNPLDSLTVVAKASGVVSARTVAGVLAQQADAAIVRASTLETELASETAREQLALDVVLPISVVATLMVAGGIYGIILWTILGRRQEFGIRIALGRTHAKIVQHVIWSGGTLVILGIVAGVVLSKALMWILSYMVAGLDATGEAYAWAVGVTMVASACAILLSARHVLDIDPSEVLRG